MNVNNHYYLNITLSGLANVPFAAVYAGPFPSTEPLHRIIHGGGGTMGGKLRLTVDGLTFEGISGGNGIASGNDPLIHIFDLGAVSKTAHFRNIKHDDRVEGSKRELLHVSPFV